MNKQNIRLALRNVTNNKLNSLIIISSLTLGLTTAFIIISWASFEFSYDGFHEKKDRIYRVLDHQVRQGQDEMFLAQVPEYLTNTFEKEIPDVELSTILLNAGSVQIIGDDKNIKIDKVYFSDHNLFEIFTLPFVYGDKNTCLSSTNKAVITKSTAQKLFGNKNPVGEAIKGENKTYTVSAVIEDIHDNSHLDFNMLVSVDARKPDWSRISGNHNASIYVLLKPNINVINLKEILREYTNRHFTRNPENYEIQFQPLCDLHLASSHTMWEMNKNKFDKKSVFILLAVALLILIVSAINFVNLTNVGYSKRNVEIGIKKINGAGSLSIVRQFLLENLLLIITAGILSVLIIFMVYPALSSNFFNNYTFNEIFNSKSLFVCLLIVFFLFSFTAIKPLYSHKSIPAISLISKKTGKNKFGSFNKFLVISQMATTTFLIVATLVILKQMYFIQNKNLGIDTEQVVIIPSIEDSREKMQPVKEELLRNAGIIDVTFSNLVIGQEFWRNSIRYEGQQDDQRIVIPYLLVDCDFMNFYDLKLVQGRFISSDYIDDIEGRSYIINESLARELGYNNPVGKEFRFSHSEHGRIVGVVKDFHFESMHENIEPMALYASKNELYKMSVKINAADISGALKILEDTWEKYKPNHPFEYQFLDDRFAQLYENDRKTTRLVSIFTMLAIVLSSLGLFGLISFTALQKTKEIGVRKVNGAKVSEILTMLNKDFIQWVAIAFFVATPIAYYAMNKWLESFAYKTTLSWWIFALAGLLALGIALLTVSWQSWRAATRNPVEALRYE